MPEGKAACTLESGTSPSSASRSAGVAERVAGVAIQPEICTVESTDGVKPLAGTAGLKLALQVDEVPPDTPVMLQEALRMVDVAESIRVNGGFIAWKVFCRGLPLRTRNVV